MTNLILLAVLALLCGGAAGYIYKAKKSGAKCIGCHLAKNCGSHNDGRGACGGDCGHCKH